MAKKKKIQFLATDPSITGELIEKLENDEDFELPMSPLMKSLVNSIESNRKITRLSFEEDPNSVAKYAGLYYDKVSLIPDRILKRICIVDDLIATIVRARGNQCSSFGHELQDRYSTGYRIEPKKNSGFDELPLDKKAAIFKKTREVSKLLYTCGRTENWSDKDAMTLPTFLYLSASNAVKFGRFATEFVWTKNINGEKIFHSFRPTDPGTIYKAVPHSKSLDKIREQALQRLERIKNEKLVPEKFRNNEYDWVQVVEGNAEQAFTSEEMVVQNCYPVTDLEMNGYPVTPIDTAISAITTHINITNHNKLYFQNGRAAKGMLVVSSDEIDPSTLQDLKQQFNAAINSVVNSFRMPIIKIGREDKVEWRPIDQGGRDMEFQYLSDSNARIILSAFNISPDELPGYSHLSRGTNSQALSEASNEYKLEAHRDLGIRPLLASLEDFLNSKILCLLDPEIGKYCCVRLLGLDAETPEKEGTHLRDAQELYDTFNDILKTVDKPLIDKKMGGDIPMNPMFRQILDSYLTVGEIQEYFMGRDGASKDPRLNYRRDQYWFNQTMFLQGQQQMAEQEKMAQQQMQMQQKNQQTAQGQAKEGVQDKDSQDLSNGLDQLAHHLGKSENLSVNKKKLQAHHQAIVDEIMEAWNKESREILAELSQTVSKNKKN